MRFSVVLFLFCFAWDSNSQIVYEHISHKSVYSFINEMANEGFISLNSVVKPYSRSFIASSLHALDTGNYSLNPRQREELVFFLKDYNKEMMPDKKFKKRFDVFYYKDSLFTFSINPIIGIQLWNNMNGINHHRWNGAEVFSYVGKHVGIYASLRDNHEELLLNDTNDLSPRPGAVYKSGQDFSEMRGGIVYSWGWGSLGLIKDHMEWGNYYHYPSVMSSKVPSVTQLKLNIKPVSWFEFNYIHGWLVSGVIDSLRSYLYSGSYGNSKRIVYRKKFIAANMFTFAPLPKIHASIGNSIIYSDTEAHPGYLIPFFLYKSLDHTNNNASSNEGGQNSQLFIDISIRQIRHLHFYSTLFFDDVSITRLKKNRHLDYYSLNTGIRLSNIIRNTFFTFEYFQSYPLVYKHTMPTTSYESNYYNLGHYLQDNSRSFYSEAAVKPLKGLDIKLYYQFARHGRDHENLGTGRLEVVELFMDSVEWQSRLLGLSISYELLNDIYIFGSFEHRLIKGDAAKYTAAYFRGRTNTFSAGLNFGF